MAPKQDLSGYQYSAMVSHALCRLLGMPGVALGTCTREWAADQHEEGSSVPTTKGARPVLPVLCVSVQDTHTRLSRALHLPHLLAQPPATCKRRH